jgi:hypothetical protein
MAKLAAKDRNKLPASSFAEPGKRAYPLNDASHARNALARVAQHGSESEKKEVRAAVHRKFPSIGEKKRTVRHRTRSRA